MFADFETPRGTCGVGYAYHFEKDSTSWNSNILKGTPGGCGWLMAGFITRNKECKEAFKLLSSKYKLVYRSSTRKNVNSGNFFYFCIFDTRGTDAKIGFDKFDRDDDEDYGDDGDWGDDV